MSKRATIPTPVATPERYYLDNVSLGNVPEGDRIVGVVSPNLIHLDDVSAGAAESGLTETIFDTTTRANAAQIKLTNSTGDTVTLRSVVIKAYIVVQKPSLVHDAFSNEDDIARNGELIMRFGGPDVIDTTQLGLIAEHRWKTYSQERHAYTFQVPGTWHWLTPGERYLLQAGGSGKAEYINSFVICFSVRTTLRSLQTLVTFYEAEEVFKYDSTAAARFFATGRPDIVIASNRISIGALYSDAKADVHVDGTADDVEINLAIQLVSTVKGGGIVHLGQGTFNITSPIVMYSNVALVGSGSGNTIIDGNLNDYSITADGASGTELTGIRIQGIKFTRTDSNAKDVMWLDYMDDSVVEDVYIDTPSSGLYIHECDRLRLNKITITNPQVHGIYSNPAPTGVDGQMTDVIIDGQSVAESALIDGIQIAGTGWTLTNVTIRNLSGTLAAGLTCISADSTGQYENISIDNIDYNAAGSAYGFITTVAVSVSGMYIDNIVNANTAANARGIFIQGDQGSYSSIKVTGVSGTGIETAAGTDRSSIQGITYGNTTAQFADNGANTNSAGLLSA